MLRFLLALGGLVLISACSHSKAPPTAPSCASGVACFELGAVRYDGAEPSARATADELVVATRYFIRACELGYDRGCHTAGNMYRLGIGVEKDLERARRFFEGLCDPVSHPEACHNLALVERELADAGAAER